MKRTPLRQVSKKMATQKYEERKLTAKLVTLSNGRCEICGGIDWRGLAKHEIIRRSQLGNEIDPLNTLLICGNCHDHVKYHSGTPLSIEEQLAYYSIFVAHIFTPSYTACKSAVFWWCTMLNRRVRTLLNRHGFTLYCWLNKLAGVFICGEYLESLYGASFGGRWSPC